jgi:cell division protein FtsA
MLEQVSSGCVLTGGAALMEGMIECAQEILGMPVRLGFPVGVKGIFQLVQGPQYATGVGLVRYGAHQLSEHAQKTSERHGSEPARQVIEVPAGAKGTKIWEWVRAAF